MIKLNSGGKLPDKFRIANQEITVVMEDSIPNNNYGRSIDYCRNNHIWRSGVGKDCHRIYINDNLK